MLADQWCETSWRAQPGSFVSLMTLYESNFVRLGWLVSDLRAVTARRVSRVAADCDLHLTPQELSREAGQYRFVPDKKSELTRPGALMPGAREHIAELQEVEQAMQRESFYRYVIRYWRKLHVLLVFVTLGLTLWHLVYAAQLLLPTLIHK